MLPKEFRLDLRRKFSPIKKNGKTFKSPLFIVLYNTHSEETVKVGFVLTKKIGKATVRQRLRRLLRESVRNHISEFPSSLDVVFIARIGLLEKHLSVIDLEIQKLLRFLHGTSQRPK